MDRNTVRLLAIATQIGFGVAVPLLIFVGGGAFLDKKTGHSPLFLLIGLVIGLIGAGYELFDLVRKLPAGRQPPPKRPNGPA
ncbi:MAG: AtpZ/AtpI family protein [Thermomicrobia bacterium]|nr:AtpZ/AtpI family protein [Thermomicrobia bacterium]